MSVIPKNYIEKLYAGWLGKLIGIRYGAPIEGWSYERIKKMFGNLDSYLVDYKEFAADDDSNGPMFFLRALEDYTYTQDLTAEEIGLTWLNYAPYEHGFYWWGGYGVSTEHTAYLNLRNNIPAPHSGSVEQNGHAVAEQIGGQIFIDTWGLTIPNNPALAAEYAKKAASVSHGGNGIYGGMFIAACISAAFVENEIREIIDIALETIPQDSEYTKMTRDVISYYEEDKSNWEKAFLKVKENYGYHLYPGNCHIIPNSAVIVLSLLFGEGDFDKSINICNMCGWDTDCNVANVGAIVGVLVGMEGIDYNKWILPINDFIACSSVIGDLNIMDVPWGVRYMAYFAYKIADEEVPARWRDFAHLDPNKFDFELPTSTHSFKASGAVECGVINSRDFAASGSGSLKAYGLRMSPGDELNVGRRTYYNSKDFHDSRYDPCFSPTVYPGETIKAKVKVDMELVGKVKAAIYVLNGHTNEEIVSQAVLINNDGWFDMSFQIPSGDMRIEETGVKFCSFVKEGWDDSISILGYIDDFEIVGNANYKVDFNKEINDKWHNLHSEVTQFTYLKGNWYIDKGKLVGRSSDFAETYTGRHNFVDYEVSAKLKPLVGYNHQLNFRVEGAIRSYALALMPNNKVAIRINKNGYENLVETDFGWNLNKEYSLKVDVLGNHFKAYIDDEFILEYSSKSEEYKKGQVGFSLLDGSCCEFNDLMVKCK